MFMYEVQIEMSAPLIYSPIFHEGVGVKKKRKLSRRVLISSVSFYFKVYNGRKTSTIKRLTLLLQESSK